PFIRSGNIQDLHFDHSSIVFISETVHQRMRNSEVLPGDALLAIVGASIGRVTLAPLCLKKANINQAVARIRPLDQLDAAFLVIYLSSEVAQAKIRRAQGGVARDNLDLFQVRDLLVPAIGQQLQRAIGNKLRKADRLRELAEDAQRDAAQRLDELLKWPIALRESNTNQVQPGDASAQRLDAKFYLPA